MRADHFRVTTVETMQFSKQNPLRAGLRLLKALLVLLCGDVGVSFHSELLKPVLPIGAQVEPPDLTCQPQLR